MSIGIDSVNPDSSLAINEKINYSGPRNIFFADLPDAVKL
jgi:hypothetical protein